MLSFLKRVPSVIWVVLALVVGANFVMAHINKLEREVTAEAFAKDSIEAFTTQTVLKLAGQRKLAIRRAVQTDLVVDSLNRALQTKPRVRLHTVVIVDTVSGSTTATGDSSFKFHDYKQPYALDIGVQVDGTTAKLDWTIKQDPFTIGARVDCGEKTDHGVRPAYVTLDMPKYMTATIDSVKQSREVCSGGAQSLNTGISRKRAYTEAGLIVGGVLVVTKVLTELLGMK